MLTHRLWKVRDEGLVCLQLAVSQSVASCIAIAIKTYKLSLENCFTMMSSFSSIKLPLVFIVVS